MARPGRYKVMREMKDEDKWLRWFTKEQILYLLVFGAIGNEAVIKICKRYSQEQIDELIDETPFLTDTHKEFYKYILRQRFEKILLPAYKKLTEE